jgi:hypothetical protein
MRRFDFSSLDGGTTATKYLGAMKYYLLLALWYTATCGFALAEAEDLVDFSASDPKGQWAFEFGVAVISENNIGEIFSGDINRGDGPAGGEIYQFKATKTLDVFAWNIGGEIFRPHLEMPLCLEVVDENGRRPFLDYNASVQLRWVDFPWNSWIETSIAIGLGLSYSEKIYAMDIQRHPGENRSHMKFNLPIEISFGLPGNNNERLSFYLAHQSGGFHLFDKGGVNSLGIAFSRTF